jgi:hypothetical protein
MKKRLFLVIEDVIIPFAAPSHREASMRHASPKPTSVPCREDSQLHISGVNLRPNSNSVLERGVSLDQVLIQTMDCKELKSRRERIRAAAHG